MTATDELRKLLDERGVEWRSDSEDVTFWNDTADLAMASESWGGRLWVSMRLTPEQAIATLDTGTCSMEYADDVPDSTKKVLGVYFCSECGFPTYSDVCPTYCMYCGAKVEKVES